MSEPIRSDNPDLVQVALRFTIAVKDESEDASTIEAQVLKADMFLQLLMCLAGSCEAVVGTRLDGSERLARFANDAAVEAFEGVGERPLVTAVALVTAAGHSESEMYAVIADMLDLEPVERRGVLYVLAGLLAILVEEQADLSLKQWLDSLDG